MAGLTGVAPVKNRRYRVRSDRPFRKSRTASPSPPRAERISTGPEAEAMSAGGLSAWVPFTNPA